MTGINNPTFFIGVVEHRDDPRMEGRVKVRAFGFHGKNTDIDTQDLPWATLILGHHSTNFSPPPLNAWVLGFFADGQDAQQPFILGIIPTQMRDVVDPATNGHGSFGQEYYTLNAMGHRPEDVGQPMTSPSARGEFTANSIPVSQSINRIKDAKIAGTDETWSQAGTPYAPKYPYNHVTDTASGHSIQMDDTPGSERVLVYHRAGSYMEMDAAGNTVIKSASDTTNVTEGNHHTYIGGAGGGNQAIVTIMGDYKVYVEGNKVEEVRGDYTQIVRGNYILDVAGEAGFNIANKMEMRSGSVLLEANVEHFTARAAQDLRLGSGASVLMKSNNLSADMGGLFSVKASDSILRASGNAVLSAPSVSLDGGSQVNVKASTVSLGGGSTLNLSAGSILRSTEIVGGASAPSITSLDSPTVGEIAGSTMPEPRAAAVASGGGGGGSRHSGGGGNGSLSYAGSDAGYEPYGGATPVSSNNDPIAEGTKASVKDMYDHMRSIGLSHQHAVGALVNIKRESNFRHWVTGDQGKSFGLFQFYMGGGRAQPFMASVPDWKTNPLGQITYMFKQDALGKSYAARKFSTNLEAANWFTMRVEIPARRHDYTAQGGYNSTNIGSIEAIVGTTA